jgi:hypothetical protein
MRQEEKNKLAREVKFMYHSPPSIFSYIADLPLELTPKQFKLWKYGVSVGWNKS